MANIIRVISKDQKQFERCKKAIQLYEKDAIVYRVTKPQQLELIGSTITKIVVLPKGFDCMKAWEEAELRKKADKLNCGFYSLTEKKFKEFEQGPSIVFEAARQTLEELTSSDNVKLLSEESYTKFEEALQSNPLATNTAAQDLLNQKTKFV